MNQDELRRKIAEVLAKWYGDHNIDIRIIDRILALIKEAGYVKLAKDQSLPENPYPRMTQCADEDGAIQTFTNPDWMKFHMAEDAMLQSGFRRIEL